MKNNSINKTFKVKKKVNKTKFRAIVSSCVALGVVAAVVITTALSASSSNYYSLEYIEELKAEYSSGNTLNILEIAPSVENSTFGYLVGGSEPIKDWLQVATMYNNKDLREEYVKSYYNKLKNNGFGSTGEDKAPIEILDDYEEWYPTDTTIPDDAKIMELDMYEEYYPKGTMYEQTGGEYTANSEYLIAGLNYKNNFSFTEFKQNLSNLKGVKNLSKAMAIKNGTTKVFALNSTGNSLAVFGSTQKNWAKSNGYESYYDLTSIYKTTSNYRYYSFEVDPDKTYSLNFEALVNGGKGHVSIVPLDENYNVVYYYTNYSKQYALVDKYFNNTNTDGDYEAYMYDFHIPKVSGSNKQIKYVQIRFDVDDIETFLKVRELEVREYEDGCDIYNIKDYKKTEKYDIETNIELDRTITRTYTSSKRNLQVSIKSDKKNGKYFSEKTTIVDDKNNVTLYKCNPRQIYTLTYHLEYRGYGSSLLRVYGYNSKKQLITTSPIVEDKHSASGTYSCLLDCSSIDNLAYIGVCYGGYCTKQESHSYYSNVSITQKDSYVMKGNGEYVQDFDHFLNNNPGETLTKSNVFNYDKWYVSGSNVINDSLQHSSVTSYENGIIELHSNDSETKVSTKYSTGEYVQSDLLYYFDVEAGNKYQLKFRVSNYNEDAEVPDIDCQIRYYDENRSFIKGSTQTITASSKSATSSKDNNQTVHTDDGYCITDIIADGGASYASISFQTTDKNQHVYVDYIGLFKYETPEAYYYYLDFEEFDSKNDPKYIKAGKTVLTEDADGNDVMTLDTGIYPGRYYYTKSGDKYTFVEDISTLKDEGIQLYRGVPLYTVNPDGYKLVGTVGGDGAENIDSSLDYYYYVKDEANARFIKANSLQKATPGTKLYVPDDTYEWAGNFTEGDFYLDEKVQYFTAKINTTGYAKATANNSEDGTTLYKKSGENYVIAGLKSSLVKSGIDIYDGTYFVKVLPVAKNEDAEHKYYVLKDRFRKPIDDEVALFSKEATTYTYVGKDSNGVGLGNYSYSESGSDRLIVYTKKIFYVGGLKNNEWFKRFVLDYNRFNGENDYKTSVNNLDYSTNWEETEKALEESCNVKVSVYTPAFLNSFKGTADSLADLKKFLNGFELIVINAGTGRFTVDLDSSVKETIEQTILKQSENDETYIPVIIDVNVLNSDSKKVPNLIDLASAICTDSEKNSDGSDSSTSAVFKTGGVNNYIYRFDGSDLPGKAKYISNKSVITVLNNDSTYTLPTDPYYEVWQTITYENTLRTLRRKFVLFNEKITEADCIRHILNYKGQRTVNHKSTIKILEIQPLSDQSQLYWYNLSKEKYIYRGQEIKESDIDKSTMIDIDVWFNGPKYNATKPYQVLTYVDPDGKSAQTEFEITTMSPYELNGKTEDLAELYDLVYVGTSLENVGRGSGTNTKTITDKNRPDYGDVVPSYESTDIDELFYISQGDTFNVSSGNNNQRSQLSGLVYDDYTKIGKWWYVDSSDCTLRGDGNDITDTKMDELQVFIEQGLPVVVSDNLSMQDFYSDLKIQVSGMTYYQREGRTVYLQGHEGDDKYSFQAADTGTHVLLQAQLIGNIPDGVILDYKWYSQVEGKTAKAVNDTTKVYGNYFAQLFNSSTSTIPNKHSIDTDGDGYDDLYFIDIKPNSDDTVPSDADYYCRVNFKFNTSKNVTTAGSRLKFNGLFANYEDVPLESNRIYVETERRQYNVWYFDYGINTEYAALFKDALTKAGVYNRSVTGSDECYHYAAVYPIPENTNDYAMYRFLWAYNGTYSWEESPVDKYMYQQALKTGKTSVYEENKPGATTYTFKNNFFVVEDQGFQIAAMTSNHGDMKNFGVNVYFNDNSWADSDTRVSVGYRGTFGTKYSRSSYRTYALKAETKNTATKQKKLYQGFKLYLKAPATDANGQIIYDDTTGLPKSYVKVNNAQGYANFEGNVVDKNGNVITQTVGGYSITGYETNGITPITGGNIQYRFNAALLPNRIDTSTNLYDVISYGFDNYGNVFTQNQIERENQSISYREKFIKYANLSEPRIVINESELAAISYPNSIGSTDTFTFSFTIENDTEVDTINTRYSYRFYVDENGDGQFDDSELADNVSIYPYEADGLQTTSDANGIHSYQLSTKMKETSSPLKPWKLVIEKIGEPGAHTSLSRNAYVRSNAPKQIFALQVLPGDWDPEYVCLFDLPSGYNVTQSEKLAKDGNKLSGMYDGNWYKGSVFLSDIFTTQELKNINSTGAELSRTIYYCTGDSESSRYVTKNGIPTSIRIDDGFENIGVGGNYTYDKGKKVHHVQFTVGYDYIINIYFTNISDLNTSYASKSTNGILDDFDMIIMGFGDSYAKLPLGKTYNALHNEETLGFNQNATIALENVINSNVPVLFTHDTTTYNVNFINYLLNDLLGYVTGLANDLTNWWNQLKDKINQAFTGDEQKVDYDKYNGDVHSSRLKQGYYSNLILRESLGLDAYGVTAKIKERANYSYNDDNLKTGHSYNSIYDNSMYNKGFQVVTKYTIDGVDYAFKYKKEYYTYNEGKDLYRSLSEDDQAAFSDENENTVAMNCLLMEVNGFKVSWVPTKWTWNGTSFDKATPKSQTSVFFQGFTTEVAARFENGDSGTIYTDMVTQENKGKITTYPYNINLDETKYGTDLDGETITGEKTLFNCYTQVSETHPQYFQINLNKNANGATATVWFCLSKSNNKTSDSNEDGAAFTGDINYAGHFQNARNNAENSYFMYTKGNVTYTGAGHHNVFNEFEAKLFINTIIASDRSNISVPKVKFYDETGIIQQTYQALVGESITNDTVKYESAKKISNNYIVWNEDLHFKINNTNSAVTGLKNREVYFYTLNSDGSENIIKDAEVYGDIEKTSEPLTSESDGIFKGIVPGQVYTMPVPESVLKMMVDDSTGKIKDADIVIYIHVDLTDAEKNSSSTQGQTATDYNVNLNYFYAAQVDSNNKYVLDDNDNKVYIKVYYRDEPKLDASGKEVKDDAGNTVYETKYYTMKTKREYKAVLLNGEIRNLATVESVDTYKDKDGNEVTDKVYSIKTDDQGRYISLDTNGNESTHLKLSGINPNVNPVYDEDGKIEKFTDTASVKYKGKYVIATYDYLVIGIAKATVYNPGTIVKATVDKESGEESYSVSRGSELSTHDLNEIWYTYYVDVPEGSDNGLVPYDYYGESPDDVGNAEVADSYIEVALTDLLPLH